MTPMWAASPGDAMELAAALRSAARSIRNMNATAVAADLFNDILTPESYASLFEDLANKADPSLLPTAP